MIPASDLSWQSDDWRQLLAEAVTDPAELLRLVGLADHPLAATIDAANPFPVRVPQPLLARIERGRADDPILRQVLAIGAERATVPGYDDDPLQEAAHNPAPGLLHKYRGRALLIVTGACAVHCRYCFRRQFPYADNNPGRRGLDAALGHIAADPDLREVILSGGDPLLQDDDALDALLTRLEAIPTLERLRIHTRFPIVIPQRITSRLVERLAGGRLKTVFVLHANHARELDGGVADALDRLRDARIPLLNQAVLLRGVNDDLAALMALSERLFDLGVMPYYLHLLDRVAGAAHFEVPEGEARELYDRFAASTSGYLVPRLVRETAGAPGKHWLPPRW
ncbi:MAG TPA: EF-P beta-lysylation protein EpmB [Pseudomonadales bacterium]|nr:EF-P beta-lysylation protein EpmB [Pseudomonadales bacterium]